MNKIINTGLFHKTLGDDFRMDYEQRKKLLTFIENKIKFEQIKVGWEKQLPKKFNGADLCAVREDFGWWVGYDCQELDKEISATGKTLDEAFNKLNDYWFKSGKCKQAEKERNG